MCSGVVGLFGEPFDIETSAEFSSAVLTFKVDKSMLGDTEFDNLLFLWYDKEWEAGIIGKNYKINDAMEG